MPPGNAVLSKRGCEGVVGYDLSASYNCVIPSRGKGLVQAGLAISLPSGGYARIAHRSGLALKNFIDVGVGVVDSDYRGELTVVLYNHSEEDFKVNEGDRVAQLNPQENQDSCSPKSASLGSDGQMC